MNTLLQFDFLLIQRYQDFKKILLEYHTNKTDIIRYCSLPNSW